MKHLGLWGGLAVLSLGVGRAQVEPMMGQVGRVNLNLVLTRQVGGFQGADTKVVADDPDASKELYKTKAEKQKYGTVQFIEDLLERYTLEGPVSQYVIRFVQFSDGVSGYFLASKDESVIVYIGGHSSSLNASLSPINTYYTRHEYHASSVFTESATRTRETSDGQTVATETGSYRFETPGTYLYFNPAGPPEERFECFSLVKGGAAYKRTEVFEGDSETPASSSEVATVKATVYSGIVGTNYEGLMLTGSLTVAALKKTENVDAYHDAYLAALE